MDETWSIVRDTERIAHCRLQRRWAPHSESQRPRVWPLTDCTYLRTCLRSDLLVIWRLYLRCPVRLPLTKSLWIRVGERHSSCLSVGPYRRRPTTQTTIAAAAAAAAAARSQWRRTKAMQVHSSASRCIVLSTYRRSTDPHKLWSAIDLRQSVNRSARSRRRRRKVLGRKMRCVPQSKQS